MGLPRTLISATINFESSTTTARSATWQLNTQLFALLIAAWSKEC
jgi:hypothetical protein